MKTIHFDLWHGTNWFLAKEIVSTNKWICKGDHDKYLGKGIYFSENSKFWACTWSKNARRYKCPTAINCKADVLENQVFDFSRDRDFRLFRILKNKLIKEEKSGKNACSLRHGAIVDFICAVSKKKQFNLSDEIKVVKAYNRRAKKEYDPEYFSIEIEICVKDPAIIQIVKVEECN